MRARAHTHKGGRIFNPPQKGFENESGESVSLLVEEKEEELRKWRSLATLHQHWDPSNV